MYEWMMHNLPHLGLLVLIFTIKTVELVIESYRVACLAHLWKIQSSLISIVDVAIGLIALRYFVRDPNDWTIVAAISLGYGLGNYLGLSLFQRVKDSLRNKSGWFWR